MSNVETCGCGIKKIFPEYDCNLEHLDKLPEYKAFKAAKRRCESSTGADFRNYGARGIKFLFTSFEQFAKCVGRRPSGCSLDRINNDGNYESGNVRWATPAVQALNRRSISNLSAALCEERKENACLRKLLEKEFPYGSVDVFLEIEKLKNIIDRHIFVAQQLLVSDGLLAVGGKR